MSWVASIIGVIGAGASAYKAFSGDDEGGQVSSENQINPATWSSLGGGGSRMWEEFVDQFFGGQTASINDAKAKLTPAELEDLNALDDGYRKIQDEMQKHHTEWLRKGRTQEDWDKHSNVKMRKGWLDKIEQERKTKYPEIYGDGALDPQMSLQEKMAENLSAQEGASSTRNQTMQQLVNQFLGAGKNYTGSLANNEQTFRQETDKIGKDAATPYMRIALGGQPVDMISKRQLSLADQLGDLAKGRYLAGSNTADKTYGTAKDAFGVQGEQADRVYQHGQTYTPHAADAQFFDKLWPIVSQLQGFRYSTPSSVNTASYSNPYSVGEQANAVGGLVDALSNLGGNFGNGTSNSDIFKDYFNLNFVDQGLF